jgi:hypothetical protein
MEDVPVIAKAKKGDQSMYSVSKINVGENCCFGCCFSTEQPERKIDTRHPDD